MKKLFAMAFPILPGQTPRWRKFSETLKSDRKNDFVASRLRLGVQERTFLQSTPMGDYIVVTLEGDNPQEAFTKFGHGNDEFTRWFTEEVKAIHGIDLKNPPKGPLPELVIDTGALTPAKR